MNTATILKHENREAWLTQRNKGIGGTDISAILGVNKWKTPYDVWLDKTGRAPKFEGNKMTRRGQYMEDAVTNYFTDVTGNRVIKASEAEEMLIHNTYPFLLGSPDRRYFSPDGKKGILECKTTMASIEQDMESIPQAWFIQGQWYMGLSDYKIGTIAWGELGFTSEFKHLEIDFNPDFFAYMVEQAVGFWEKFVMNDTPPPATTREDILKMYPFHSDSKYVDGDAELEKLCESLKSLKSDKKQLEGDIEIAEDALKLLIGDAEGARYNGAILATWKAAKGSVKFDDKALKEADPVTWSKYTKETTGSRRLLLK